MRASTLQQIVAIVCLVAVGINAAVFARGFVHCADLDGSTRLEWGCAKDDQGHCQLACDGSEEANESSDHTQSKPCDDTPANNTVVTTDRTINSKSFTLPPLMPVAVVQIAHVTVPETVVNLRQHGPTIAASPPSLLTIRTVVILV